ncbi:hypothetical protein Syun_001707 [Stephania yunnanensis]|uniref:Uncharacterized protein n=1 Tax=Stephania yunnanensis TaxID=152371 RepID=A0AAP0Q6J4_9MAGN
MREGLSANDPEIDKTNKGKKTKRIMMADDQARNQQGQGNNQPEGDLEIPFVE